MLACDAAMADERVRYMEELPIPGLIPVLNTSASASEDICPIDAACLAHCAVRWLAEHPGP